MSPETTRILGDFVVAELARAGRPEVLGPRDLAALLSLERQRDLLGCDAVACANEIAGALDVRYVLSGTVNVLGGELSLLLSLIDTHAGAIVRRGEGRSPDREAHYRDAVADAVAALYGLGPTAVETAPPSAPPLPTAAREPPMTAGRRLLFVGASLLLSAAGVGALYAASQFDSSDASQELVGGGLVCLGLGVFSFVHAFRSPSSGAAATTSEPPPADPAPPPTTVIRIAPWVAPGAVGVFLGGNF